jgi:hypothetical protein
LWAVEPPQTRFAHILATGSLPPLMEVKSVCVLHGNTHASFEAAGQGEMNNGFLHTVEEVAESGIPESYWEPLWRKVERMEKHQV